jgi:(E)-4-hydroxy-3-methylbut-2-enyl-diphosphate synthase
LKKYKRKKTKVVKIGSVKIGGNNPIAIQSMTNTDTRSKRKTIKQIQKLEREGCEIIRIAVPDIDAAKCIKKIKKKINIPLVADIHYDYKLAIESVHQGADKIRINPGNIGERWKVEEIVKLCKDKKIPIRVGANSGSLKKEYIEKFGGITPMALVESVIDEIKILEELDFKYIVVSLKSSDVRTMIEANRIFSENYTYPLHIGVTEAGPPGGRGETYSAVGIGTLLEEGIGDTIRVSLTGDPSNEVQAARNILSALDLRKIGPRIISCPTCGRLQFDLESFLRKIEKEVKTINEPITIAVMGCSVNGPGEAKEADIGIAGGKKSAVIFKKGEKVITVNEKDIMNAFMLELNNLLKEET